MLRKAILLMLSATLPLCGMAQALTLSECRRLAHDNYPAIKQYGMIESLRDYTASNAAKAWLPQIGVSGSAYGFTDIIDANSQMKAMGVDTKNYVASGVVTIKQNVYDGGQIAASKQVAKAQAEVQKRQLDVTMHDIDERVEQLFFGILTLDEQLLQNNVLQKDLGVSRNTVESLMKSGLANQSDLDAVTVEFVKAQQQSEAFAASRKAYTRALAVLTGKQLDENTTLAKPDGLTPPARDTWSVRRPENAYYDAQNTLLDTQRNLLDTRLRPTIGLVGLGAIHTKMSDMVHNGMLLGGVSLSWNIGTLYTRKNDLRKLDVMRQQNENARETFLFNNRLQNEEADGSIQALRKQLDKDGEIVSLRERIKATNEKRVAHGTETVNELLRSINAVSMARQQQSLHEIQLLQSICRANTINN